MTQTHHPQPPTTTTCAICNFGNHIILHNHIEHRTKTPQKLCTTCFLKLYPTSFCPTCFNLHDPNSLTPPPLISNNNSSRYLTCFKCNSISHVTCVPPNSPKSPYLCPPCSNPNFKFFDFRKRGNAAEAVVVDEKAARVLELAAKMAVVLINKVAGTVKSEAERKVKEAALAKKRAKEAIDHVMVLSSKFVSVKQQRRDVALVPNSNPNPNLNKNGGIGGVNGNGNGNVAVVVVAPSNGNGNGNVEKTG